MKIGFYYFATDYSMPIVEVAKELEAHGYESLFVPEHTHIPASRRSPWPGGPELPRQYSHTLDPYVGLAAAAAVTKTLRLGTGVSLLTERDPIVTAKSVATLDLISHGRFEFGIGAAGTPRRWRTTAPSSRTASRSWSIAPRRCRRSGPRTRRPIDGEFTNFEKIWSWPKPVQKPHPPILLGGETKYTLRRVMEFCDGWFPRGRGFDDPKAEMARLKSFADEAGRDIKTVSTTLFGTKPDAGYVEQCRAAGLDRALFALPPEGRDAVMPVIEQYTAYLE